MASFRRGAAHIRAAAEKSQSSAIAPIITWRAGDKKFIQFVTPMNDIPTVLYHAFMSVGTNDFGKPIYRSFISRKDSAIDGDEGYDPIIDRFGLRAKSRCIAVAVELEPLYEREETRKKIVGFNVATREVTRDGHDVDIPSVGFIVQSPLTFFGTLTSYSDDYDIEKTVFKVTRRGGDQNTAYDFVPVGDATDLSDIQADLPDLDKYLDELSDLNRIKKYIDKLPDDHILDYYQQKEQADAQRGKTRPAPADSTPPWAADEETEEQVEPPRRRRTKFDDLRAQIESQ